MCRSRQASNMREQQPVRIVNRAEDGHIRQLWAAEALRRRDDVRSGRVKTIPSDEAMVRVRRAVAR